MKPRITVALEESAPAGSLTLEQDALPKDTLTLWICADSRTMRDEDDNGIIGIYDMSNPGFYVQGAQASSNPALDLEQRNGISVFVDRPEDGVARAYELPAQVLRKKSAVTIFALARVPTGTNDQALLGASGPGGNNEFMTTLQSRVVSGQHRIRGISRLADLAESSATPEVAVTPGEWVLIEWRMNFSTGESTLTVNGVSDTDTMAATGVSSFPPSALLTFWGRRRFSNLAAATTTGMANTSWNSEVTDFAIFDGILPAEDRSAWLTYLQSKQATLTQ